MVLVVDGWVGVMEQRNGNHAPRIKHMNYKTINENKQKDHKEEMIWI